MISKFNIVAMFIKLIEAWGQLNRFSQILLTVFVWILYLIIKAFASLDIVGKISLPSSLALIILLILFFRNRWNRPSYKETLSFERESEKNRKKIKKF